MLLHGRLTDGWLVQGPFGPIWVPYGPILGLYGPKWGLVRSGFLIYIYPPPCRQARQGVFGPSSGGLMSGICVFPRDPQPVTRVTRLVFFEHFFGSYFLMTFWSPMIPQSVQVGLHVGSFLGSCCLTFPIFSGVYLGS